MEKLRVDRINNLTSFEGIKKDWEQLYKSDSNSHLYISWLWQYSWFSTSPYKWVVLGVKNEETSTYVAFLPLTIHNRGSFGIYPIRHIVFGGKPISIYSGFLCSPEFEFMAIRLLASYIQSNLRWDIFNFNATKDPRLGIFLDRFPNSKFLVEVSKNLSSLCITLPRDYQTYLSIYISKETRRNIRRKTRYIKENERYKITYSTANTIDRDVNALCELWFKRWQKKREVKWHRNTLHHFFENDLLRLSIIWDGEAAVSAAAGLIDNENKTFNAYITSYNPDYSNISPGFVLGIENIKLAIEQGYNYYDFATGLDSYKQSFGPKEYQTKNVSIKRKRLKTVLTLLMMKRVKSVFKKILK